jgi:uncharacterized protein YggU (UPF0235/DUF167 family)
MKKGEWAAEAIVGARFTCQVVPRARRNAVSRGEAGIRIEVTAPAEGGKANAAVGEALAHALGVAKTRLRLIKGATAREKVFELE